MAPKYSTRSPGPTRALLNYPENASSRCSTKSVPYGGCRRGTAKMSSYADCRRPGPEGFHTYVTSRVPTTGSVPEPTGAPNSDGAPQHSAELRHLRYFVAVADGRTFTQAGERMYTTRDRPENGLLSRPFPWTRSHH